MVIDWNLSAVEVFRRHIKPSRTCLRSQSAARCSIHQQAAEAQKQFTLSGSLQTPAAIQQDLHNLINLSIILDLTQVTSRSWVRLLLGDQRTSGDLERVPSKNDVWAESRASILSDQNFSDFLKYMQAKVFIKMN